MEPERRLSKVLFWLVLCGGLLQVAIVLAIDLALDTGVSNRIYALSAGIAGSAIWWALFARYAEGEARRLLSKELEDQRKVLVAELDVERRMLGGKGGFDAESDGLPSGIYASQDGFDLRFNRDLTADLERSERYWFRGPTGIYVAARIALQQRPHGSRPLRDVQLRIIDPTNDRAMSQAVSDRRRKHVHNRKPLEQIQREIRDDVFMTVVALFDVRRAARHFIVAHAEWEITDRTELLDDALYEADVGDVSPENYPFTARWARQHQKYRAISAELTKVRALEFVFEFDGRTPEDALLEHLARLGFEGDTLEALRARYDSEYLTKWGSQLGEARKFSDVLASR